MNNIKRIYRPLLYKVNVVWTNSEEVIINYLNSYQEKVFIFTQKHLAAKTHTSEATVSRFCKKLGFDSYKSFVFYFNQILLEFNKEYPFDYKTSKYTIKDLISKNFFAIKNTLNLNVIREIDKASSLICKSKRIVVFGYGFSGRIATELGMNLLKIGLNVFWNCEIETIISIIASGKSKDLYIFFYNSVKDKEIYFLLEEVKKSAGVSILITSNKFKFLNDENDILIQYEKIFDEREVIPAASKTSQSLIADALFESTLNKKPFFQDNLLRNASLLKRWKNF